MDLRSSALTGISWTGSSTLFVSLLQIGQVVILANLLTPTDFGLMGIVLIVIGFGQALSDSGISAAIIHFQDLNSKERSSLYWINVIGGFIMSLIIMLIALPISAITNEPEIYYLLIVTSGVILISGFGTQFKILFQKELKFKQIAQHDVILAIVYAITSISLAVTGWGVWALVLGYLLSVTISTIFITILGFIYWRPVFYISFNGIHKFLIFGFYQIGERLTTFFNLKVDQLLIALLLDAQMLGYYTLAINLVIYPVMRLSQVLNQVIFPVLSKIQNEEDRLKSTYLRVLKVFSLIQAPVLAGVAITVPDFVPLFLGEEWLMSVPVIQILTIYAFLRSAGSASGSLVLAKGRADLSFKWNLVILFLTAPVIYIGIYLNGLSGAATSLSLLHIILSYFFYRYVIVKLIGPTGIKYFGTILVPVLYSIIMVLALIGIRGLISISGITGLLVLIFCGVLIYSILIWIIDRKAINELRILIRKNVSN